MAGTIYLIQNGNTTQYKIGITTRDLNRRVAELQTGSPYTLEAVAYCVSDDFANDEIILHNMFADKRLSGEWFELNDYEVQQVCEYFADVNISRVDFLTVPTTEEAERLQLMAEAVDEAEEEQLRTANEIYLAKLDARAERISQAKKEAARLAKLEILEDKKQRKEAFKDDLIGWAYWSAIGAIFFIAFKNF